MLATFGGEGVIRGTAVLVSDTATGPYMPWSDGAVTPRDWQCLDGTLHVDTDGVAWIVFCHEWIQVGDGEILAQRLTGDLRSAADDPPVLLFRGSEAPWTRSLHGPGGKDVPERPAYVTDGPYLHRSSDGTLLMVWSSFGAGGYTLGVACSESGHVLGPWAQEAVPLWPRDGGHGMIARLLNGDLVLLLHQPNDSPNERAVIKRLRETAGGIEIDSSTDYLPQGECPSSERPLR